jgi:NAD(P)-dependent dehydrogenase (short-subunit alcohol dehydrogenase family)
VTGRISVVTGGAGALGSAIVDRLAGAGEVVVVVDRDGDAARAVADRVNADRCDEVAYGRQVDISSEAANRQLIDHVRREHGRLDRLVNNAAIMQRERFGEVSAHAWASLMEVNLWGPASLSQAAAALWRDSPGGSIVNMASRTWVAGGPMAYASSKAGLVGLTRALAVDLAPFSVTVNAVAPSTVVTPMVAEGLGLTADELGDHLKHARELALLPRLATAEDVANAVAFLSSAEASFITGEVLHVCGGAQLAPAAS